jgi:hypothetical protein
LVFFETCLLYSLPQLSESKAIDWWKGQCEEGVVAPLAKSPLMLSRPPEAGWSTPLVAFNRLPTEFPSGTPSRVLLPEGHATGQKV